VSPRTVMRVKEVQRRRQGSVNVGYICVSSRCCRYKFLPLETLVESGPWSWQWSLAFPNHYG